MPHPPTIPSLARPAEGNPYAWFDPDSYPAAALFRSAQGRAVARLAIGADGRVTGCTIISSSGNADLDRATCAVPMRKGHYTAARSAAGLPIAGSATVPVRWELPNDDGAMPVPPPAGASDQSPRYHHGWFERLLAAHHLIGVMTAVIAFVVGRGRRWLGGPTDRQCGRADGDRMPVRRRRKLLTGRWGRLASGAVPVVLLAAVMAWLGW